MFLVVYDIADGRKLRRVAKTCEDYGVRIQKSVFECALDADRFQRLWSRLCEIIDDGGTYLSETGRGKFFRGYGETLERHFHESGGRKAIDFRAAIDNDVCRNISLLQGGRPAAFLQDEALKGRQLRG